ncbi:hypothetical protein AM1_D0060 (plasmid) [Acaryochloris marina MBIC11017]|uniref:Uncharacterized protein n=1 Tax=Acaryochloris marina (strain MBIC 11017) TaxID=329726 RepID=A8ZNG9_ACAM1|nr:hypothetical protein AM1_D0060 [Acaryochloris marina MBIC11017]
MWKYVPKKHPLAHSKKSWKNTPQMHSRSGLQRMKTADRRKKF